MAKMISQAVLFLRNRAYIPSRRIRKTSLRLQSQNAQAVESLASSIRQQLEVISGKIDFPELKKRKLQIEEDVGNDDFWNDMESANAVYKELGIINRKLDSVESFSNQLHEHVGMAELGEEESDEEIIQDCITALENLEKDVVDLRISTLMTNKNDPGGCFLQIQAGAGGEEAEDWAEALYHMYVRFCSRRGYSCDVMQYNPTNNGIQNATLLIDGEFAYGWLRAETGVHRRVRISPYGTQSGTRQTSFSSILVSPIPPPSEQIQIDPSDLKFETMRSGGPGGQHANTCDSAVRVTHVPTGIAVKCGDLKEQDRNKEMAIKMIQSKLEKIEEDKKRAEKKEVYDALPENSWGSQIRNYTFNPYQLVKDTRTKVEVKGASDVMDGNLEYLLQTSLEAGL